MRLLFDENLSPRLVQLLTSCSPGSDHVELVGLRGVPDALLWEHARTQGSILVSKDNDFRQLSFLQGPPPKVIWLSVGNAGTDQIAALLRARQGEIEAFASDAQAALLVLRPATQEPAAGE